MNQRDNASPLRRLIGLLLLCGSLYGCAVPYETARVFDLAKRTTHVEPRFFEYIKSDRIAQREARLLADQAWAEVMHTVPVVTPDYQNGFTEGFADYLYRGGSGEIPLVPPRGYWKLRFLNPRGKMAIEEWYAGFKHGVQDCQTRGIREMWVVPTSFVSSGSSSESHSTSGSMPTSEAELWSASESLMLGDPATANQTDGTADSDVPPNDAELLAAPQGNDVDADATDDQALADSDLDAEVERKEADEASSLEFREMLEAAIPDPGSQLDSANAADELDLPTNGLPTNELPANEFPDLDVLPSEPDTSDPFRDDASDPFMIPGDEQPSLDFDPGDLMEGDDQTDPFSSRRGNEADSVASTDRMSQRSHAGSDRNRSFVNRLRASAKPTKKVVQAEAPRELPLKLVAEAQPVKSSTPAVDVSSDQSATETPSKAPPMKLVAEAIDPSAVTTASANLEVPIEGEDSLSAILNAETLGEETLLPTIPLQVAPSEPPGEVWVVPDAGHESNVESENASAVNRWDAWSPVSSGSSDSVKPVTWTTEEDRLRELPLRVNESSPEMPRITIPDPAKVTQQSADKAAAQNKRFLNFEGPHQSVDDELRVVLPVTTESDASEENTSGSAKSTTKRGTSSRRTEPPLKVEVRDREVHLRSKSGSQRWTLD